MASYLERQRLAQEEAQQAQKKAAGKETRRKWLGRFFKTAVGIGLAGVAYDLIKSDPPPPPKPVTPGMMADYYLTTTLPEQALYHRKTLSLDPGERKTLKDMIVKYESLRIKDEDAFEFFDGGLSNEEKEFMQSTIDRIRGGYGGTALSGKDVAVQAVRELDGYRMSKQGHTRGTLPPLSADVAENGLRARAYNKRYGALTETQAEEFMSTLGYETTADHIRKNFTSLDYRTAGPDALKRGLCSYITARGDILRALTSPRAALTPPVPPSLTMA